MKYSYKSYITLQSIPLQHFINEKCQNSFSLFLYFLLTAGWYESLLKISPNQRALICIRSCITLLLVSNRSSTTPCVCQQQQWGRPRNEKARPTKAPTTLPPPTRKKGLTPRMLVSPASAHSVLLLVYYILTIYNETLVILIAWHIGTRYYIVPSFSNVRKWLGHG